MSGYLAAFLRRTFQPVTKPMDQCNPDTIGFDLHQAVQEHTEALAAECETHTQRVQATLEDVLKRLEKHDAHG